MSFVFCVSAFLLIILLDYYYIYISLEHKRSAWTSKHYRLCVTLTFTTVYALCIMYIHTHVEKPRRILEAERKVVLTTSHANNTCARASP